MGLCAIVQLPKWPPPSESRRYAGMLCKILNASCRRKTILDAFFWRRSPFMETLQPGPSSLQRMLSFAAVPLFLVVWWKYESSLQLRMLVKIQMIMWLWSMMFLLYLPSSLTYMCFFCIIYFMCRCYKNAYIYVKVSKRVIKITASSKWVLVLHSGVFRMDIRSALVYMPYLYMPPYPKLIPSVISVRENPPTLSLLNTVPINIIYEEN